LIDDPLPWSVQENSDIEFPSIDLWGSRWGMQI